jgi:hypothetical protein
LKGIKPLLKRLHQERNEIKEEEEENEEVEVEEREDRQPQGEGEEGSDGTLTRGRLVRDTVRERLMGLVPSKFSNFKLVGDSRDEGESPSFFPEVLAEVEEEEDEEEEFEGEGGVRGHGRKVLPDGTLVVSSSSASSMGRKVPNSSTALINPSAVANGLVAVDGDK